MLNNELERTTDTQAARNLAKALWGFLITGEFGIPTAKQIELLVTIAGIRALTAAASPPATLL